MKAEEINVLFARFESVKLKIEGVEYWSAREMQSILGYTQWKNFEKVIQKAKSACENAGEVVLNHFSDVGKMVELGSGSVRKVEDIALTRYASYLIAQNGDPSKSQIAFAQTYFAVQTRKQEIIEQRLLDIDKINVIENSAKLKMKRAYMDLTYL